MESSTAVSIGRKWPAARPAWRYGYVLKPLLFLLPALALYAVFFVFPFAYTLFLSFHQWDMISPDRTYVGLDNFRQLLRDEAFWTVMKNTVRYMLMTMPVSMTIGLTLALLTESLLRGRVVYRFVFYLPVVSSVAVVALVWSFMYNPHDGLVNESLRMLGIRGPNWLSQSGTSLWAVAIVGIWKSFGAEMLFFISGLKSIDRGLYEAASIDGANRLQQLVRITLPLLSPVLLFLVIVGIISSFQSFALIAIMTKGGPNNSSNVLVYEVYQEAFQYFDVGKAAAISIVMFLLVVFVTVVQLRLSRNTVHYQ